MYVNITKFFCLWNPAALLSLQKEEEEVRFNTYLA
jgi:hypothetical protein